MLKYIVFLAICCGFVAAQTPNCTNYCTTFMQNCNIDTWPAYGDDFYTSMADCMAVCAAFPVGTSNDKSGNTIGCRTYHAGAPAIANATLHCPHASSYGGGVCGTYCEAYCNMSLTQCTAGNGYPVMGSAALNNYATCMKVCQLYPLGAPSDVDDTDQNTLACRIYHSQAAITSGDFAYHCPHASPNGNDVCGTPCEAYCSIVNASCGALYPAFTSNDACEQYCDTNLDLFWGTWNDTSGDTVGCRIYHADAYQALGPPHCLHASPSGDNVCGAWCTVYCDLVIQNCFGANAQYNGTTDCMNHCNGFSTAGYPGDITGNTVQCRIYHAGVAGLDISTNAHTHCPHAGPTGGGQCVGTPPTHASTGSGATTGASSTTGGKSGAASLAASFVLIVAMIVMML